MASKKRDANAMIGRIQDFLAQDNPDLKRSTTWNDQTNLAFTQWVKELQAKHGITQTGNFGEKTLAALREDLKNGKFSSEKEKKFAQAVLDLNKGGVDSQNNNVSLSTLHSRNRAEATPIPVPKPADPQAGAEGSVQPRPIATPAPPAVTQAGPAGPSVLPPVAASPTPIASPAPLDPIVGIPVPDTNAPDELTIIREVKAESIYPSISSDPVVTKPSGVRADLNDFGNAIASDPVVTSPPGTRADLNDFNHAISSDAVVTAPPKPDVAKKIIDAPVPSSLLGNAPVSTATVTSRQPEPVVTVTPEDAPVQIESGSVTDRVLEAKVSDPSETLDYITKHLYKNDKRGQGLSLMDAAVVLNQYAANDPDKSNPVINPDRLKEFAQANGIDMAARFRTRDPEQLATLVTHIAAFNSGKKPDEVSRQWGSEIEAASYKANHKSVPSAEEKASANPANNQTITVGTVLASLGDAIIPSAAASTTAEGDALLQAAAAKQQADPVINIPLPEASEGLIVTREVQPIADTEPTLKERASNFMSHQFQVASASAGYLKDVALSHIKAALTGTEPEKVVPEYVEGLAPVPEAVDGALIVNLENEAAQQAKTDPGLIQTFTDSLTRARASASYLGNSLVSSIEGYFQEAKAPEPAKTLDIERVIPTPDTSALPLIVEAEKPKEQPETAAPIKPQQESGGWGLTRLFGSIASRVANVFKQDTPTTAKTQAFEFQQDTRAATLMGETQEDPASFVASQLKESGVSPVMRLTDAVQIVTALNSPDGQTQADAFATNFDASNRGFDISSRYDTRKTDQFQTLMTNLALFLDKTKMASDSLSEEQTRQIRSAVQPAIPSMAVPGPQPLAARPAMS